MHSEIHIPEVNRAIQQKLKTARDKDPRSSFQAIWDRVRKENPEIFRKLQAADRMEEDRAEGQEAGETHGSFKPSIPGQHQFYLEPDDTRLFHAKLQGPKRVEATKDEPILCVGGFFNPL
jgi:hypothetical protein